MRSDGFGGAELLAAVLADEHDGERIILYSELPSRGVPGRGIFEEVQREQVAVLEGRFVVLEEVALVGVRLVGGGGGEDQEEAALAAMRREVRGQDCSRARSAVSCVALA
ncbi:MAG: hypothetical protein WKF95_14590 [Rubrobacter sp.]